MVRFLTRRFIGSYSSSVCCAYPHTVSLDNALWPIVVSLLKYFLYDQIFYAINNIQVWDTPAICPASISSMCAQLDDVLAWADVIITVYRSARDKVICCLYSS